MGINLSIQNLKTAIANDINNSKLSPGIVLMILSEFTTQVQAQNQYMISKEMAEEKEGDADAKEIQPEKKLEE